MIQTNTDNQIPCIVDQGIIFNKKDMLRVLQALDHVEYVEFIDGKEHLRREGFIVEIFEDETQATIIFNRRLHLNVNSFEFFQIIFDTEQDEENKRQVAETQLALPLNQENEGAGIADGQVVSTSMPFYRDLASPYQIELSMAGRKILLIPKTDPIHNPGILTNEVEERRRGNTWVQIADEADFEE